jgi:hypothetical protein
VSTVRRFSVGNALRQANAYKSKGYSPLSIVQYVVQLVFMHMSMHRDSSNGEKSVIEGSRDAVCRFMRSAYINWNVFLFVVAVNVIVWVDALTSSERLSALVLDDTMNHRPYSKKLELVSPCVRPC